MSTDSTELTFVRCPSCRSLVPAVSTRCRMCGASIEAQGKESPPSGDFVQQKRARQNTITQPPTEFVNAVDAIKAKEVATTTEQEEGDDQGFDPLHDYLDDDSSPDSSMQTATPQPTVSSQSAPSPFSEPNSPDTKTAESDDDFDLFADDDDWLNDLVDDLPEKEQAAAPEKNAPPQAVEVKEDRQSVKTLNGENRPPQAERKIDSREARDNSNQKDQPRVVIESGQRPPGKPSAFSFGKGKVSGDQKGREQNASRQEFNKRDQPEKVVSTPQHNKSKDNNRGGPATNRPRFEQRSKEGSTQQQNVNEREARLHTDTRQNKNTQDVGKKNIEAATKVVNSPVIQEKRQRTVPANESVESRLVGWLVSFSTPTRTSTELREGKFFVSGSSLKPNDLVIDDPSISTPHAIVAVESGRLQVQDLMSETGICRRAASENDFVAYGEPFDLKHGDWVRFGNVDFLVTMIPTDQD